MVVLIIAFVAILFRVVRDSVCVAMPNAWGQVGWYSAPMVNEGGQDGTTVFCSTRFQRYFVQVYETSRPADEMLEADGAFAMCYELGILRGGEVGKTAYAGANTLTKRELDLLWADTHAFEKVLRRLSLGRKYHYMLVMQSYGPTYGAEAH